MAYIPENKQFVMQRVLEEGVKRFQRAGFVATSEIRYGRPAEQIVLCAREMGARLIVVGHRDQGALARWLNGSVGESILRQPPCSVLIAIKPQRSASSGTPIQQAKARRKA